MRIWYGLRATAFKPNVEGHGDGFRRDHYRACRKRIFIDYQLLDNEQAGSGMQLAKSWSGPRALQPLVEGRGCGRGHPYAHRKGINKSLDLAFAFLPRKKPRPGKLSRPRCVNEVISNKCDLLWSSGNQRGFDLASSCTSHSRVSIREGNSWMHGNTHDYPEIVPYQEWLGCLFFLDFFLRCEM